VKVLVVRFSSIGDIVLTTPVLRSLKDQLSGVEVHFLTKRSFAGTLELNPDIDRLFTIDESINECLEDLKRQSYAHVIDLHNNIRTSTLALKLGVPVTRFPKYNVKKWLYVRFKIDKLPNVHIVDRYFKTVEKLGVQDRGYAVSFPLGDDDMVDLNEHQIEQGKYVCIAVGARFATKQIPVKSLVKIIDSMESRVVLLGGNGDVDRSTEVLRSVQHPEDVVDLTGRLSLRQSASVVQRCDKLLTGDTGLMHIASAFDVQIESVWGNTTPKLGMYPYRPKNADSFFIHEVEGLDCRPCSKIGFEKCPKGHFKCMNDQNLDKIVSRLKG
jgi:ADP-heptose:LPS heptosyltransferase